MARSTLAALIDQLRGMTDALENDYRLGTINFWDDDQVQQVLDRHRADVWREQLAPIPLHAGGGTVQWKDYQSRSAYFEATDGGTAVFVVENAAGDNQATSAWSADYARGLISFTADTGGSVYFLTGRSYDLNAAAADVWRAKAAQAAKKFDFSTDNHSVQRSQLMKHALEMASYYESLGAPLVVTMHRSDTP